MGQGKLKARAELDGREWVEFELALGADGKISQAAWHALGCHQILEVAHKAADSITGSDVAGLIWTGTGHADLMVAEIFARLQNRFELPYKEDELCHCRKVPTARVDQAIVLGAHTPEKVRAWTSASSGCGTCRPDVEKLIEYRVKK